MKKKKKAVSNTGKVLPGWMASYADMFTVLMAFFVLMFAASTIDREWFDQMAQSLRRDAADIILTIDGGGGDLAIDMGEGILPESPPPPPAGEGGDDYEGGLGGDEGAGDVVGDMLNTFMTYMAENIPGNGESGFGSLNIDPYDVVVGENFIRIPFDSDGMLFNSGDANLLPAGREALNFLAPLLQYFVSIGHGIVVEGHTDNVPMTGAVITSNWALSSLRASNIVEYLVETWGINPDAITGSGRGEHFPIADNDTPEGRARNRRVEILVFERPEGTESGLVGGMWTIPMH